MQLEDNMMVEILNKILVLILCLSSLNVVRHGFFLIGAFFKSEDDVPQKYILMPRQLFFLGLSIAYILTIIFTGIKL